jgi:hypothetical protein
MAFREQIMSDYSQCTQCGVEIESSGIQFHGHIFCSDECCEEYDKDFLDKEEPGLDELDPEEVVEVPSEDDFDFVEKVPYDDLGSDDDFDINPEDF